jgi:putative SbcD/Mre11-related phosphoesterase
MKFLYNAPAIYYKKALIIGDTHFGIESKLLSRGIYYQNFSNDIFEKIKSLLAETKAEKLIILGDVKEKITSLDAKTADILARLSLLTELIIVRGNHDGGIEGSAAKIISSKGFVYGKLALVHGHAFPGKDCMNADYLISAHQHPQLSIVDKSGKRHNEPVWIFAESDPKTISNHYTEFNRKIKLILMPAFNPLVGATFNSKDSRLGPILSNNLFKINAATIYRLEGTRLGELKDLMS